MRQDPPSIRELRDIVVPDPPSYWPPAPAFWVVLGVVLLLVGLAAWRWSVRRRRNAYRRAGRALLNSVAQCEQGLLLVRSISVLLKRVALAAFPRPEVAPLSGDAWLAFLDRALGTRDFTDGPGRLLAQAAYSDVEVTTQEVRALVDLADRWISQHTLARRGR